MCCHQLALWAQLKYSLSCRINNTVASLLKLAELAFSTYLWFAKLKMPTFFLATGRVCTNVKKKIEFHYEFCLSCTSEYKLLLTDRNVKVKLSLKLDIISAHTLGQWAKCLKGKTLSHLFSHSLISVCLIHAHWRRTDTAPPAGSSSLWIRSRLFVSLCCWVFHM